MDNPLPENRVSDRPSILLFMCDQLNAAALGCYGGPFPTPNLDRLAGEGVRFTDATCPYPVCSPSRASLVTGLYPHAHGIVYNVNRRDYPAISVPPTQEGIKLADVTTEGLLHAAGYRTHHYGKWHLLDEDLPYYPDMYGEHHEYAREMRERFESVRAAPRESWMDWYGWALPTRRSGPMREAVAALGDRWADARLADFVTKIGRLEMAPEETFDARVADHAAERLRAVGADPFMLTCSFNWPHDPNVVPSPYYEAIDPDAIPLPANREHREPRFEENWSRRIVADLGEAASREVLRVYHATVKLVDDGVGRVLSALEAAGRAGDTIVVFTADHGDMAGGHGMVWKSTHAFYDEIVRVPMLIRWPGRIEPGVSGAAANLVDLMPTLLELAGQTAPEGAQGESLAPLLLGEAGEDAFRPYAFSERVHANAANTRAIEPGATFGVMVRGQGWKYVRYEDGDEYLYDLARDPGETRNLAREGAQAARKAGLVREIEAWLDATGYRR